MSLLSYCLRHKQRTRLGQKFDAVMKDTWHETMTNQFLLQYLTNRIMQRNFPVNYAKYAFSLNNALKTWSNWHELTFICSTSTRRQMYLSNSVKDKAKSLKVM